MDNYIIEKNEKGIELDIKLHEQFNFKKTKLAFELNEMENLFQEYGSTRTKLSLKDAIEKYKNNPKYKKKFLEGYEQLSKDDLKIFEKYREEPVGIALLKIKQDEEFSCYQIFLHDYGDKTFCKFGIDKKDQYQRKCLMNKGVYFYLIGDQIQYVGSTLKNFKSRIYQHGRITGINCFLNGRPTDCRINFNIYKARFVDKKEVENYYYPMENEEEIRNLEHALIYIIKPLWNYEK